MIDLGGMTDRLRSERVIDFAGIRNSHVLNVRGDSYRLRERRSWAFVRSTAEADGRVVDSVGQPVTGRTAKPAHNPTGLDRRNKEPERRQLPGEWGIT